MNIIAIVGRVTRDPMVSYTTSQTAVAKFNIAVQRPQKNSGADYPNCTAFGKVAETIEKYVHKGDKIGIQGHIQTSSYESDGKKVYTTEIIVDRVEFLNSREDREEVEAPTDGFSKLTAEDIPFED